MSEAKVRHELEKCFDFFDNDKSGFLDYEELLKVALKYNEEHQGCGCKKSEDEVKEIINALDKDKDNKVSKEEFVNFLLPHFK